MSVYRPAGRLKAERRVCYGVERGGGGKCMLGVVEEGELSGEEWQLSTEGTDEA